ncbi:hypothetical protein [Muricoccus radiodurans]|uniref:hypothetical protein n=1 Tax=Muricoccus radiodurans TaxID=2231721 RepID=UPI003CF6D9B8
MAPAPPVRDPGDHTLRIVEDLALHASQQHLEVAEALLMELLAVLHGWPIQGAGSSRGAESRDRDDTGFWSPGG